MALTPNFTTSESLGTPENITFTDTSTGADASITARRIYIVLANGNYLTTAGESTTVVYEDWDYADTEITLALLSRSTVGDVTVKWMNGSTVLYTKTILNEWNLYDYLFAFELLQSQTATPGVVQDSSYYSNFFMYLTNLWNAENAVEVGNDIYSAQSALDRNYQLSQNSNYYF